MASMKVDQRGWLQAAIEIASDHDQTLEPGAVQRHLDELATPLREGQLHLASPLRQAQELSGLIYERFGFSGDHASYDDPANSLISQVLTRRRGIPITLALVYCEVATRLGVRAAGISFPGHFLVKIVDTARPGRVDRSVFIDPFEQGQVLSPDDLASLAMSVNGSPEVDEAWLQPATINDIRRRMLNNLRAQFQKRRDMGHVLLVLHRMCQCEPEAASCYRERGLLHRQLGAHHAAIDDLERYLELAPRATDAQQVSELLDELRARLQAAGRATLN